MPRMSEKTYRFWTTLCLILAVASAFLFDGAGHLNWLVGVVGIVAAIASACIYFYNSTSEPDSKQKEEYDLQPVSAAHEYIVAESHEYIDAEYVDDRAGEGEVLKDAYRQLSLWSLKIPHADLSKENVLVYLNEWPHTLDTNYWRYRADSREEIQPKQFVNEVVEIVERLSKTCEFELNLRGGLIIRPRSTALGAESIAESADQWRETETRKEQIH
jgi:hypothetical protein